MPVELAYVLPFVFLGAVLYSSVGHGGATIYLAVLTLAGYLIQSLVTTVLVLNILVASIAFLMFRQAGHLRVRVLVPFAATSVPLAFVGGLFPFSGQWQMWILGAALILAAARLLFVPAPPRFNVPLNGWLYFAGAPVVGAVLGFVAGATGIGGGIFLSPIVLLLGWGNVREAGNVASAFIVLNSASGLAAKVSRIPIDWGILLPLAIVVAVGGLVGSFLGARRLHLRALQILLGLLLLSAGLRAFL